jgi:predicted metalloprotease with PDZ domain
MVRQVMTQLREKGSVTRARLGVYFQELTPKLASALNVKATTGVVVIEILPNGPAEKSGLRKDDVIVSMHGKELDGRSLRLAIGSMTPGTTINLKSCETDPSRIDPSRSIPCRAARAARDQNEPYYSTARRGGRRAGTKYLRRRIVVVRKRKAAAG